jgi:hypothetical protein
MRAEDRISVEDQWSAQRLPVFNATAPAERDGGLIHSRPTVNWADELASPEPAMQDPELRRLVDLLPADERHIVERVYFGGASSHAAARELNLPPYAGERLRRAGLNRLKDWLLNGAPKRDPDRASKREYKPEPEKRAWQALDPSALEATMRGRYRGDGRRLDAYTSSDPVEDW